MTLTLLGMIISTRLWILYHTIQYAQVVPVGGPIQKHPWKHTSLNNSQCRSYRRKLDISTGNQNRARTQKMKTKKSLSLTSTSLVVNTSSFAPLLLLHGHLLLFLTSSISLFQFSLGNDISAPTIHIFTITLKFVLSKNQIPLIFYFFSHPLCLSLLFILITLPFITFHHNQRKRTKSMYKLEPRLVAEKMWQTRQQNEALILYFILFYFILFIYLLFFFFSFTNKQNFLV